jgi:L-arabinokinase
VIRTSAPRWLFDRTLRVPFQLIAGECDTGVAQIDSLRIDESATVRRAAEFYGSFEKRATEEAALLEAHGASVVIADAPPLACAAAARVGIPSIVVGNFTWDWIYGGYGDRFAAEAPTVIPTISDAYSRAAGALRLPMHGGFEAVARVTDVPFVARHARPDLRREDVLTKLGLPTVRPLALSSFGGYGLDRFDLSSLDCLEEWTIVLTGTDPPSSGAEGIAFVRESMIYDSGLRYEDLVAACDVVVTKPGYGIISECIANGTAMLYTSRGAFREYDVLVREMPRYLRCAFIDSQSLLAGRWLTSLDALLAAAPPPERPRTDGADVVAERIAGL